MKKITVFISSILLMFMVTIASADMAVVWDAYTDPTANFLRLESSIDNSSWSTSIDNIATTDTALAVTQNATDYQRVYYRMVAFNGDEVSLPSNVVSYFWTMDGGGQISLQTPGGLGVINCSDQSNTQAEKDICTGLGLSLQ